MDVKVFEKIKKAIKIGSLNPDSHANGDWFKWHSLTLLVMPLFCSYGQIGYTINVKGETGEIHWDYECKKFEVA